MSETRVCTKSYVHEVLENEVEIKEQGSNGTHWIEIAVGSYSLYFMNETREALVAKMEEFINNRRKAQMTEKNAAATVEVGE